MFKPAKLKLITTLWLIMLVASFLRRAYVAWTRYGKTIKVGEKIPFTTTHQTQAITTESATILTTKELNQTTTSAVTSPQ